jgi:hypothetical protein
VHPYTAVLVDMRHSAHTQSSCAYQASQSAHLVHHSICEHNETHAAQQCLRCQQRLQALYAYYEHCVAVSLCASMQVLPDYSSGNNEKDIHVHNFGIEIGGLVLLEGADLKLSFGRKYGLTGKNGIGKCTAQHNSISLLLYLLQFVAKMLTAQLVLLCS